MSTLTPIGRRQIERVLNADVDEDMDMLHTLLLVGLSILGMAWVKHRFANDNWTGCTDGLLRP